jgi:hypothetical protein
LRGNGVDAIPTATIGASNIGKSFILKLMLMAAYPYPAR